MVTLTKVPPIPEAWKFAWDIFLPSLVYGKIGESQCLTLGRFHWRNVEAVDFQAASTASASASASILQYKY